MIRMALGFLCFCIAFVCLLAGLETWYARHDAIVKHGAVLTLLCLLLSGCFHDTTAPEAQRSQSGNNTVTIHLCVYYFPATDTVCP